MSADLNQRPPNRPRGHAHSEVSPRGDLGSSLLPFASLDETGERENIQSFLAAVAAGNAFEIFKAMGKPMPNHEDLKKLVHGMRERLSQLTPPPNPPLMSRPTP